MARLRQQPLSTAPSISSNGIVNAADLKAEALPPETWFTSGPGSPCPRRQITFFFENGYTILELEGAQPSPKCLLIATGAQYRRLDAEGFEKFEGPGSIMRRPPRRVYYAADPLL